MSIDGKKDQPNLRPASPAEVSPSVYSLSEADFSQPPATLSAFHLGDRVTRENFTSFLILGFSVSRGSPTIQLVFFMWLQEKYGLDYKTTFAAFNKSGSWECLSQLEKEKFYSEFSKVPKHTEQAVEIETELGAISNLITANTFNADMLRGELFDFKNINSLNDFTRSADKHFAGRKR